MKWVTRARPIVERAAELPVYDALYAVWRKRAGVR